MVARAAWLRAFPYDETMTRAEAIEFWRDLASGGGRDILQEAQVVNGIKVLAATLEGASVEERTDPGMIKEKIRVDLQRFFRKRSGLRPLVVPVVMEV